jgi:hypothetical protein
VKPFGTDGTLDPTMGMQNSNAFNMALRQAFARFASFGTATAATLRTLIWRSRATTATP